MPEIILHHYPQSPVSEKVRVVLGIKGVAWRSVEIPRLPPKPELMPLTGGYRQTPVMQVGADVFCDSQCIIRALEHHHPEPTLFPGGGAGMAWGVGRWTDGPLFTTTIAVIMADGADTMPAAFFADRIPLYFGPEGDLEDLKARIPENLASLRAQIGWMNARIATGRPFMLGPDPGLPDALCYYLIWFIRGRYSKGPEFLAQFPALGAWEDRVKAIGHGTPTDMSAQDALDVARAARPAPPEHADPGDPQGLKPGDRVTVTPDGPGAAPAVEGTVLAVTAEDIAILRDDDRVGTVAVHFPRVGYRVRA
jgi:glutathione S-transferase